MIEPSAVAARQLALDQIRAVAGRLRRDTGLAFVGDLARQLLAAHRCVGMTEVEVIEELTRLLLLAPDRGDPVAEPTAPPVSPASPSP